MAYKRYHPDRLRIAGPRTSRAIFTMFGIAALVGLLVGVGWVIAGLVYFHVLR